MAGFASMDDLLDEATTNGKEYAFDWFKYGPAAKANGVWTRLWASSGMPGAGGEPSATPGDAFTNVAGSINFPNQSPDHKHFFTFGGVATQDCVLMVYDRLTGVGGVSIATTGNKTIDTVALPRYAGTDALGVQVWIEVTTAVSAGTPAITLNSYTAQDGTTGRSGAALTLSATPTAHAMYQLPLQSGDLGVRSVETINVGVAGTSGVVNVVLVKPLVQIPLIASQWNEVSLVSQLHSLPRVYDGASLGFAFLASTTTAPNFWGCVRLGYG